MNATQRRAIATIKKQHAHYAQLDTTLANLMEKGGVLEKVDYDRLWSAQQNIRKARLYLENILIDWGSSEQSER